MKPGLLAIALLSAQAASAQERDTAYVITDTSVVQEKFSAVAVTRDRIETNYPRAPREVMFKFSINGQDNEFPPGTDHMIYVRPRAGRIITPVYQFGRVDAPLGLGIVWWTNRELIHHTGEIGVLRDLWAARQPTG